MKYKQMLKQWANKENVSEKENEFGDLPLFS